ncbi:MAG: acetate kinase [Cyclobacteriaceae bacterium]
MKILVLNSGSSSIKYQLFEKPGNRVLLSGIIEKIGEENSHISHKLHHDNGMHKKLEVREPISDHEKGLEQIVSLQMDPDYGAIDGADEIVAVGHRVVHGGEEFSTPTLVDEEVLHKLHKLSYLAPLHNPHNLKGIEVATKIFKRASQVAVFDTSFHQTMPAHAYRFPIPESFYKEHGLRAFGFHGTSHQFVSQQAASYLRIDPDLFNTITIHLGNGCSMAAIQGGKCVDTSMGLTPLGGLMMGTRSGDIDPSLILFLAQNLSMSIGDIDRLLNKESGLKGLTGDNDLRNILSKYEKGDPAAELAIEMYIYRIKKYVGAYAAILGRLDALIFTAGVGENSSFIRDRVCQNLSILGVELDDTLNHAKTEGIKEIQSPGAPTRVMIVPTNEELHIANQVFDLIGS